MFDQRVPTNQFLYQPVPCFHSFVQFAFYQSRAPSIWWSRTSFSVLKLPQIHIRIPNPMTVEHLILSMKPIGLSFVSHMFIDFLHFLWPLPRVIRHPCMTRVQEHGGRFRRSTTGQHSSQLGQKSWGGNYVHRQSVLRVVVKLFMVFCWQTGFWMTQ